MSGVYTDDVQTRTVTNDDGKTKTFKSTGVDKKGKHFFTSSDNAKIREFKTGEKPNLKTGIPIGAGTSKLRKSMPRGDITKKIKSGGMIKYRGGGIVSRSRPTKYV